MRESSAYRRSESPGATETVVLGPTGLRVGAVGVGTNSWGSRGDSDPGKRLTFDALLAAGVTLFDTAEIYTAGSSEKTIGRCIRDSGMPPGVAALTPTILSKFFPFPWRLRKKAMNGALGRSLSRLQVPRVDVYLLHFPWPPVSVETWADALADEVKAGRARAVGVSNCDPAQTRRAHAALAARGVPLACNEVEYNLLNRGPERSGLLSTCRELGITLIAYRPLAMGMLTGKYSPERRTAPLLEAMRRIGDAHGKTPAQVAINWLLAKGALPIPGAKNAAQAGENAGAMGWRMHEGEVIELDELTKRA